MKFKKILAGVVAVTMAMTCLPQVVLADDGNYTSSDGIWDYMDYEDGTIWLSGYHGTDADVTIPEEIDGKTVTGIQQRFMSYFGASGAISLAIPKTVVYINSIPLSGYFKNSTLTTITVDEENPAFKAVDDVLFSKDMNVLYTYPSGKSETEYTVPESVKCIEYRAFSSSSLTSITLPDGLIYIGHFAFPFSLTSITIPATVIWIGNFEMMIPASDVKYPIKGYIGSYAEIYAQEQGITFEALDGEIVGVTLSDDTDEDGDCGVKLYSDSFVLSSYKLKAKKTTDSSNHVEYDISIVDSNGNTVQPNGNVTVKMPIPEEWEDCSVYWLDSTTGERTELWSIAIIESHTETSFESDSSGGVAGSGVVIDGQFACFSTDHFSTYGAINPSPEDDSSTEGGDTNTEPETTTEPDTTTEAPAAATTTTPAASDNGNGDSGNDDDNKPTGVVIALLPALTAAGVIISKKRK